VELVATVDRVAVAVQRMMNLRLELLMVGRAEVVRMDLLDLWSPSILSSLLKRVRAAPALLQPMPLDLLTATVAKEILQVLASLLAAVRVRMVAVAAVVVDRMIPPVLMMPLVRAAVVVD
jgi:hypothetical protein